MRQFKALRVAAALALALGVAACGDSTTEPAGEQEVVSRVTLRVTAPNGGATQTIFIDDADGNGPGAPSAQSGTMTLTRGVTYTGSVVFENRLVNPAEDITAEVRAEANEHRVFYTVTAPGVNVTTTDTDGQSRPLGLTFSKAVASTATAGAGTVRVVLCHYASVAKDGAATSCGGDTDIAVTFNIAVN
jgi:hypothetical protein